MEYKVALEENTHDYIVFKDNEAVVVDDSVTQVLKKLEIAPSFENVNEEVLKKASELGTIKHKEMEDYYNQKGSVELSIYEDVLKAQNLMDEMFSFKDAIKCELPIVLEYRNKVIAGTIDFVDFSQNALVDYKFTSTLNSNYVEAQLNIYAYALRHFKGIVNDLSLDSINVEHLYANHKGDYLIKFRLWTDKEVEYLLDCYIDEIPYVDTRSLQTLNIGSDLIAFEYELAHFEEKVKQLGEFIKARREAILNEMLEKGIKSYEINGVKYTAVEETTRESLDTKKLKEENPGIYEKYKKTSKVKPSLRVKVVEE